MLKKVCTLFALFLLVPTIPYSQTRPRESLRGLNGVFLYVHPVDKDVEAGGLSTSQIRAAAESELRKAGIPIHSEPQPSDGSANLVIVISTVKHSQGAYLYAVEISLLQEVHLARLQQTDTFPAQTWEANALGLTGANRMDLIIEPVRAKIGEFIADYMSVNGKRQQ
jgi:hypothetical protein